MTCYFCKSPIRPWLPGGRICGGCKAKGASMSDLDKLLSEAIERTVMVCGTQAMGDIPVGGWIVDYAAIKRDLLVRAAAPETSEAAVERIAKVIHASWRDEMLNQGRGVSMERMEWDTLEERDRDLDRFIAVAALRAAQGGEK